MNVSNQHLLSINLINNIHATLDKSNLNPQQLVIEITKTIIVSNLITTVTHLKTMHALNMRVTLNDFNTNYTSINQL